MGIPIPNKPYRRGVARSAQMNLAAVGIVPCADPRALRRSSCLVPILWLVPPALYPVRELEKGVSI
jgi:hypothetical protein